MRAFNKKIFKQITIVPLLLLKVAAIVLGIIGWFDLQMAVGFGFVSYCFVTVALLLGYDYVPGIEEKSPEKMKYVVRPFEKVLVKNIWIRKQGIVVCLQDADRPTEIRYAILPDEAFNLGLELGIAQKTCYRVGMNYHLYNV